MSWWWWGAVWLKYIQLSFFKRWISSTVSIEPEPVNPWTRAIFYMKLSCLVRPAQTESDYVKLSFLNLRPSVAPEDTTRLDQTISLILRECGASTEFLLKSIFTVFWLDYHEYHLTILNLNNKRISVSVHKNAKLSKFKAFSWLLYLHFYPGEAGSPLCQSGWLGGAREKIPFSLQWSQSICRSERLLMDQNFAWFFCVCAGTDWQVVIITH